MNIYYKNNGKMVSNETILQLTFDIDNRCELNPELKEIKNSSSFDYVEKIISLPKEKQRNIQKNHISYWKKRKRKHFNCLRIFKIVWKRKIAKIITKITDKIIERRYIKTHLL